MHSILVTDKLAPQGLEVLQHAAQSTGQITVHERVGIKANELAEIIKDHDALIIRSGTQVTADIIAAATRLRAIGRAGIGVDNVDVPAATRKGIVVMNTPGGNNVTTAEHTISMMLALARSI